MKLRTLDRLLVAHVVVGGIASFCCPPLSAAAMGGTIYLLKKRDEVEQQEVIDVISSNPTLIKAMRDTVCNPKGK
jgi:hypothetical protein